ncbi:radical SAM protein [Dictyobacter arantiisoli]|uniref:Radical SAM core domain-containing protein n=1 Tax=Dictyobacter arantiisoli TaxID=2014874 RepID=A0A5A5T9J0_9CHLR|nr:radical SAM protein [Dictyobacter arantiisoli]GCF07997.1 hypothetical protein KDI_15610 [Dictyobacter arantiisoli]
MSKSVLIIAPNSFAPIGVTGMEAPFQVATKTKHLASLSNLNRLFNYDMSGATLDNGMKQLNPMAGYYLESFLRQHNYDAHALFNWHKEDIEQALQIDPIAIAFSTTYVISPEMLASCLATLRETVHDIPIIVGGPYVWKQTMAVNRYDATTIERLKEFDADVTADFLFSPNAQPVLRDAIYVANEFGEHTMLKVLQMIEQGHTDINSLSTINNLVLSLPNGSWHLTEWAQEPVDVNKDYTRWDLVDSIPDMVPIRASIGCPYRCRFCDYIELHPKVIMRSPQSLIEEIQLAKQRGRTIFNFIDDNIFLSKKRIGEITTMIREHEMGIYWGGFFRVDRVDETNIENIYESGCRYGYCGIESADVSMIKRIRKGCKPEELFRGINLCTQAGIHPMLTFIVGFPGETQQTLDVTTSFINRLEVNHRSYPSYHAYPLYVSPITSIDSLEYRQEYNLKGRYVSWSHDTMNYEEAVSKWAPYLFKQINNVPYDYYGNDGGEWLGMEKRNQAFRARNALTKSFLNAESDDQVQYSFSQLYQVLHKDDQATTVPSWHDYLADRKDQPGQKLVSLKPTAQ